MKLPADIKTILIFRALQLGDMLCHVPAMRALRHAYPEARITLACLPWGKSFAERFSEYFDDFIHFPGYPGLPEQAFEPVMFSSFLTEVTAKKFDLVLQMQGNGTIVNTMVELFGAKYTGGYYPPDGYIPDHDFFMPYPDEGPEIERHLKLMGFLGIPTRGAELEFPLNQRDQQDFNHLNLQLVPQRYVCIHPGSRGAWRQWPTGHFAALADYAATCGLQVVVTGTKDEEAIIQEVIAQMQHPAINLAGRTNLGVMGILIKNAYALVSNCTGVSHMAAAFQTRVSL